MQQYNLDLRAILDRDKAIALRATLLRVIHELETIHELPPLVMSKAERDRLTYLERQQKQR